MRFLSFFLRERDKSASAAKERLQFILAHERNGRSPLSPEDMQSMQRELIAVIAKYFKVDLGDIKVDVERQDELEILQVKIELPEAAR